MNSKFQHRHPKGSRVAGQSFGGKYAPQRRSEADSLGSRLNFGTAPNTDESAATDPPLAHAYGAVNGIPVYTGDEVDREMSAQYGANWYERDDTGWVHGYDGNPGVWYRESDIDAAAPDN